MKMRIATKLLVILLLVSLIPLLIVGGASTISSRNVIEIASGANEQIAELAMSNSTEALLNEQVVHLEALIGSTAHDVDEVLLRVQADTQELADFATYLYAHPESMGQYAHPSVYGWGEDKSKFGSIEANQNSWLAVLQSPANPTAPLPDALMNEIYLTEFLDLKFRSIAQSNPYAVQLYLNTKSQITRGMPFVDGEYIWVDATEQFDDPEIDVTQFDFYFLADEIHNPERVSVWTGLYWDPAGLGWMVSSIAPVYRGDELMGVVGIDITLGKLIDEIINLNVEQTGFAFLMSESGQAIAFPERAATFLDFDGELEGDFGDGDHFSHNLTDANDAAFQSIISDMQAGEQALTRYTLPSNQREYYLAYHPVAATQWSVGLAVPVVEIIAPAIETNRKIGQQSEEALQTIALRSQMQTRVWAVVVSLLVAAVILVAILFAKSISDPIRALVYGSGKIGEGE